ncbi:MAG: hypothetical protein ABFD86_05095 [Bryobacteraceae bacterium]
MPRAIHKSTDQLPPEALRIMAAGFAAKLTVRAIAFRLAEIGLQVPERTIARRGEEWRAEQARRQAAREQVADLVAAMKAENWESAEMLRALATDSLMRDPEAYTAADPVKLQSQNLYAEELRIKREALELKKQRHELDVQKFRAMQDRERRAAAALEKPESELTPEQRLREIQEIYGIKPKKEANG